MLEIGAGFFEPIQTKPARSIAMRSRCYNRCAENHPDLRDRQNMDETLAENSDRQLEQIAGLLQISDRLATAGQPTSDLYPAIAAAGYQVVINLALTDSPHALADEAQIARNLGLEYLHIPVIWDAPTLADFQAFASAMDARQAQKIFVHCAANKRVSVFIYLYRLSQGVAAITARQDLAKIWTPNEIWQTFIDTIALAYLHKN
jgi:protein tyrosine phosphatase (PTP) superfamily phosphohydrolase (DUF442 family)